MPTTIVLPFGDGEFNFSLPVFPALVAVQKARGVEVVFPDGSRGFKPKPFGQTALEIGYGNYDVADLWEIGRHALRAGGGGVLSDGTVVEIKDGAHADMRWKEEASTWDVERLYAYVSNIVGKCALNYQPLAPEDSETGKAMTPETGD